MVMRPGTYQASCNAGELAPELHGNITLKQYYSGLAAAENIQPVPQGGFNLLPRTRFKADLGPIPGNSKMLHFNVSRDASYVVVLKGYEAGIFKAGVQVATLALPYSSDDVPLIKAVQRLETMILFHQNYPPRRILRHGSDGAWTTEEVTWATVPDVDYGATYANVNEQWTVSLSWTSAVTIAGTGFTLSVDGDTTTMIAVPTASGGGPDWWATSAAMQAAIEDLAAIDAGVSVTPTGSGTLWHQFTIVFSGGRNSGQNYTVSGAFPIEPNAALTSARALKGKVGGEPVMSAARGWPRCAAWYQDRLLPAGFKAKPTAWAASRTGEYFDLNTEVTADSGAMLINLDADGGEAIIHMVQGAYLGLFTTEAMYHLADRVVKRNTPPNIVRSPEAVGASERVPPVVQEGSVLYVAREETIVYAATYDAVTTTFQSQPLSILASHLIAGICGADLQVSHSATDAQRYFLPRDDGLLVIACLIRSQDVQPFVRWTTDGWVRGVCVDGANRAHLLVDRIIGGVVHRYLEILEDDLLFDAAVTITLGTPATVITGLGAHEGREVWADADGWIVGPFTVVAGTITLAEAASTVTVGRWRPPIVKTLPLARDIGGRNVLKRPARVHTVQLDVIDTTSIAIGANASAPKAVTLARAGDPTDVPTPGATREIVITGLTGFTQEGQVVITQTRPGRLQVRDITLQARI